MFTRIVSLVPSITELLFDLGLEQEVIGITKFCVHPQSWHAGKTRIGGTKSIDLEKIRLLRPDLVIANKEENSKEQVEALAGDTRVWVTDIASLGDALEMIRALGSMTGRMERAEELANRIGNAFSELRVFRPPVPPRVAYLIWQNPYMTAGGDSFINDILSHCGFVNIFENEARYPVISLGQVSELDCSLLFLSSEPYPFASKHQQEIQAQLPHVRIFLVDGEMFSWYGSRMLPAADYFKDLLKRLAA
jgi:ABC-type Fe3+-hydroxamate transport system substrate-binding protein